MGDPTTNRPALVPALRRQEHDGVLQGVPVGARHRVAARLAEEATRREGPAARRRWIPALTFVAGAALVMLVIGFGVRRPPASDTSALAIAAPRTLGEFSVAGDQCVAEGDAASMADVADVPVRLRGYCRLRSAALLAQTWDDARVRPNGATLEVLGGTVMFDVETVGAGGEPVEVLVSHGRIEVLGTRFAVEQSPSGGHVDLFEGRIRFVGRDGRREEIEPGQRLGWGARATRTIRRADAASVAPPTLADPAPSPELSSAPSETDAGAARPGRRAAPRPRPDDDATPVIERVERLRRDGRFAAAAAELQRALRDRWSARTAEVLSYEYGQILQRHLGDDAAACRHFRHHRERFGRGRYGASVASALADCSDPEP